MLGLELGGDDYVVKPFSPREVVARVSAILKRGGRALEQAGAPRPVGHGRLRLDPRGLGGALGRRRWSPLTVTEFQLLLLLASLPVEGVHAATPSSTGCTAPASPSPTARSTATSATCAPSSPALGGDDVIETRAGIGYRIGPCRAAAGLIRAAKDFLKRHWPALRLRTILFATLLFVAALPGFGAVFLRVYENTLVRQTEAELIAQGAVLASAYRSFWRGAPRRRARRARSRPSARPSTSAPCRSCRRAAAPRPARTRRRSARARPSPRRCVADRRRQRPHHAGLDPHARPQRPRRWSAAAMSARAYADLPEVRAALAGADRDRAAPPRRLSRRATGSNC